jgi:acetoin utilization deacetylase AcuC-like enzyme
MHCASLSFLNNAATAAQALLNQSHSRVAILDVDYHHDNGTQSIFYERADALVISLGLDTLTGDPISKFSLQAENFMRLGLRLGKLGLPTVFILEGGYATQDWGRNAVNVLEGFEQG